MCLDYGSKRFSFILFIVLAVFSLAACGGGGDGSGDTTSTTPSLSYTGSTSKAVIDEGNAVEVSSEALNGGIRGTVFDDLAALTSPADRSETKRNNTFSTAIILQDAILQLKDVASSSSGPDKAFTARQETIDGPCGGYATGSLQIDDETGSFSGGLTFVDYCASAVVINGSANFSGTIDLGSDDYVSLTIDFDYLEASDASGTYVFDGTIEIAVQSSSITITMNMYLQDDSDDYVFWLHNFQMEVTDYTSYATMTVSGTFYDPDYGYVTLSTQQTLIINYDTMTPSEGILIATGELGSAGGPTQAKLTCISSSLFKVEADTDGDGVYDWESGDLSWDDY